MFVGYSTVVIILAAFTCVAESAWNDVFEDFGKKVVSKTEKVDGVVSDELKKVFKEVKDFFLHGASEAEAMIEDFKVKAHYCECRGYACQCCANFVDKDFGLNDTICAQASFDPSKLAVTAKITWDGSAIISQTLSALDPPPLCETVPIEEVEKYLELCFKVHDVKLSRKSFGACFRVFLKVASIDVFSFELGCIEVGSRDWNWICGYSHDNSSLPEESRHSCVSACNGVLYYQNSTSPKSSLNVAKMTSDVAMTSDEAMTSDVAMTASVNKTRYKDENGHCEFKEILEIDEKICILGCTPASYEVLIFWTSWKNPMEPSFFCLLWLLITHMIKKRDLFC